MDSILAAVNTIIIGLIAIKWSRSDFLNYIIKSILVALAIANLIQLGRFLGFIIKI